MSSRILLVEDNAEAGGPLSEFLIGAGYPTRIAASGADAIRMFSQERFVLIITDLLLPDMRGEDVVRQLRTKAPGTRVLYLSGSRIRLKNLRKDDTVSLLEKPCRPSQILTAVEALLSP